MSGTRLYQDSIIAKAREYDNTLKNLGHSKGGSGGEGKDNNNNNNNVTPNKMKSY